MQSQQIVIVGAGIVGLTTAYALLRQGIKQVTVLEQAVVDHKRCTSYGPSRLLRFEYGPDRFYSRMVQLSLERWRDMEQTACRTLYTQTGTLVLGNEQDNFTRASYHILREMGLPIERLSRRTCAQRFPQFVLDAYDMFTYCVDGGILHASLCLRTLKELILDLGGTIVEAHHVKEIKYGNLLRPLRLYLNSGDELMADRVVLAVGPWVHNLLGEQRLPVYMTRQYLLYFANLPPSSFKVQAFPAFMTDNDLYGFPLHNASTGYNPNWFKAASHSFGVPVDPDEVPPIDERVVAQTTRKLRDLLPALQQAELAHVHSCIYDVSPDGGFILDVVPGDRRLVFATGLSGHGFKFGLLLGELVSSLVSDTEPPVPVERFRLARFAQRGKVHVSSVA